MGRKAVSRLLDGFDSGMEAELEKAKLKPDELRKRFGLMAEFDVMPLRDAVDYLHFIAYTAIKIDQYKHWHRVGGAIEIATVTIDRGFRWVSHKALDESIGIRHGGL